MTAAFGLVWSSLVYFGTTQNANCKIDTSGQQTNTPAARSMKHNTGIQNINANVCCPLSVVRHCFI